jgi:hypothetical protein
MSTPTDLPTLLRFLTQDAKLPLATALSSVQALQKANLASIDSISKAKPEELQEIFQNDAKISKTVLNAAKKRVSSSSNKKRGASNNQDDNDDDKKLSSPKKRRKGDVSIYSLQPESAQTPGELEGSLALPCSDAEAEELEQVVLFTNRAPLVLAFVVGLLKHTMPEQPLSSRLSLAQAYVSMTSRARAVDLGIESGGRAAEEEEAGLGRASVTILGKEVRVLKRWGYDWREEEEVGGLGKPTQDDDCDDGDGEAQVKSEQRDGEHEPSEEEQQQQQQSPALWGLDLETLSKSSSKAAETPNPARARARAQAQSASTANLPIHTPQSARAYLLKSFDSPPSAAQPSKKKAPASAKVAEKERNLGMLLRAIDLLYQSWIGTLGPQELDRRVWGWYVRVRPAVEQGVAGWGGKNEVKLSDILALRREP